MKLKNLLAVLAALTGFFIAQNVHATCSNPASYVDGQTLTAASLNSNIGAIATCVDNVLNGDTFTGTINLHSGSDLNIYSDTGSTLKASIDGATGESILALKSVGIPYNLNLKSDTTTNAEDSITIECGNAACSATNPGHIFLPSVSTQGQMVRFTVTSNVKILLTGAHWGQGTLGDLNDAILRVLSVNDNGTLRWCVAWQGGRSYLETTDTTATQASVNTPESALCNSAVSSSSNSALEIGYVRANFDDTGGAAEDLWEISVGDPALEGVVTGRTADGQWSTWNSSLTGWSGTPTIQGSYWWTMYGNLVVIKGFGIIGTSNSTITRFTGPVKSNGDGYIGSIRVMDNSISKTTPGVLEDTSDSTTIEAWVNYDVGTTTWTNVNLKRIYTVGPVIYRAHP